MHRCESCPDTATLKEFCDQELDEHEDDDEFNYCQWDTTDRATLTTITATYKKYKETLIAVIDDSTRHSYIAKLKNYQFLIQDKIQSYHWSKEYCKLHPLVVHYLGLDGSLQHDSLCVMSDDNSHYISSLYQVQTMLVGYVEANHPHIIKN